jgi:hypothetical protein
MSFLRATISVMNEIFAFDLNGQGFPTATELYVKTGPPCPFLLSFSIVV